MIYGVVYLIINMVNGKKYVGQTTQPLKKRFNQHAKSKKTHLGNAIRKYGVENFTIEVLEECYSREQLNEREIFWIAKLNCKHPNGYNLTDGGKGLKGFTEETLARMRAYKPSPETLARMSVIQKKIAATPEGKAQLDKARTSRWEKEKTRPPEQRGWIRKCRKNVYPVIEAELRRRKIKFSVIAVPLNITSSTFARKMNGTVGITLEEAMIIKNFLGLDMTLEELFVRNDGFDAEKTFSKLKADWNTYPVLNAILEQKRISAAELARNLGLAGQTVSRKLQGKVGISPEQKEAIKKFLGVDMTVEELFKRND